MQPKWMQHCPRSPLRWGNRWLGGWVGKCAIPATPKPPSPPCSITVEWGWGRGGHHAGWARGAIALKVTRTLPHATPNPREGVWGGCPCPSAIPTPPKAPSPPLATTVAMAGGDGNGVRQWPHVGKVGALATSQGANPCRKAIGAGWGGSFQPRMNLMLSRHTTSLQ